MSLFERFFLIGAMIILGGVGLFAMCASAVRLIQPGVICQPLGHTLILLVGGIGGGIYFLYMANRARLIYARTGN